jgi:hypothetical protein
METNMANGEIEADPEIVAAGTTYLLEKYNEYLREHPISAIDTMMIFHNAHVMVAKEIARKLKTAVPEHQTYRMVDLTFRRAIRELRLPSSR